MSQHWQRCRPGHQPQAPAPLLVNTVTTRHDRNAKREKKMEARVLLQCTIREHVTTSCFVFALMNARELSAAQARDLPASWALSLSNWSWSPSPAQPLSAGRKAQGCRTESKKKKIWRRHYASVNSKRDGTVDKFTTGT